MSGPLIAGIETGGTKILARLATLDGAPIADARWETSTADTAERDIIAFLEAAPGASGLVAVGLAAFGPLIVEPASPRRGHMLDTPKPGWAGSNLRAALEARLAVPVAVETDVSAAAIAEQEMGAGLGLSSVAYVTVGTGIGAGLAVDGLSLKGALHPEAGHLTMVRQAGDARPSHCPFHAHCAEGLAAGPALQQCLGGDSLASRPDVVELIASYLGQLGAALVLAWSPQRIVWGGGVIGAAPMTGLIAAKLRAVIGGYGVGEALFSPDFCVEAELENAGLEGALIIARRLAGKHRSRS